MTNLLKLLKICIYLTDRENGTSDQSSGSKHQIARVISYNSPFFTGKVTYVDGTFPLRLTLRFKSTMPKYECRQKATDPVRVGKWGDPGRC